MRTVHGEFPLNGLAQILDKMKAIGDLGGGRRSLTPSREAPGPDDQQGTGDAAES